MVQRLRLALRRPLYGTLGELPISQGEEERGTYQAFLFCGKAVPEPSYSATW